jgi:hypothetical protein
MAGEAPPPGEPVHLPGPTYLPVIVAFGVTLMVAGIVIAWYISLAGLLITLIAIVRWVRETREEIGELPLDH